MPDSVLTRYSCREFTPDPVTVEQLQAIIRAGMQAPTAKNEQPWEFLVVRSEQGREALAASSPYAGSCRRAPVVIVENMLIEAVEQGLGGVWLGMYPRQDRVSAIREAFELPENLIPFAAVPVGYPAAQQKAKDRFDPKRIRWEG